MPLSSEDALGRFEATGLPVYARLDGPDGAALLVGASTGVPTATFWGDPADDLARLTGAGFAGRVLDADMTGATYYLAYPAPGRPVPYWSAYGRLLLDDGRAVLLRAAPGDAERLAADGAEIVRISLTPKPLRPATAASFPPVTAEDPLVRSMIDQVSQTTLNRYVGDLSGEWPAIIGGTPYTITTRHTGSGVPIEKATQYVREHLTALGMAVEDHPWSWTNGSVSYSGRNVIGQITGETPPGQIFIIGAHLDDMPVGPTAPGADDNASGSAAVLVAADILSRYRWGCTLRFALWTGEEQGLLGSDVYAHRSYLAGETIAGVLNLDMIAWNTVGSTPDIDLHASSALPATLDQAYQFEDVVHVYGLNLVPQVIPNGIGASDHRRFWEHGYPAILGIEDYLQPNGDFNPRYHKADGPGVTGDRLQNLDMSYFTDFVKASVGATAHMSDCLLTGNLDGDVTAAHDGSGIIGASVTMTEAHGLSYATSTGAGGDYTSTLPAATYTVTASAYGYLPATAGGVVLPTGGATQDFVLQAAPAAAPEVGIAIAGGKVRLSWTHVPPNMTYQVHRSTDPYFDAGPSTLQATLTLPFERARHLRRPVGRDRQPADQLHLPRGGQERRGARRRVEAGGRVRFRAGGGRLRTQT